MSISAVNVASLLKVISPDMFREIIKYPDHAAWLFMLNRFT